MESSNMKTNISSKSDSSSHFTKTICLWDWWLVNSEKEVQGKTLAIAGLTSAGHRAIREFSSSPIIKVYNSSTMMTADGICIVINGFLNKLRTCENGFSSEVFKNFVFGFPPNWHECASSYFIRKHTVTVDQEGVSVSEPYDKMSMRTKDQNDSSPTIAPSFIPEETQSRHVNVKKRKEKIPSRCDAIMGGTNVTLQNECHLHVVQSPVNRDCAMGTQSNSRSSKGGNQLGSNLKTEKGKKKEKLTSGFVPEDKEGTVHKSVAIAFRNLYKKKLNKTSTRTSKKKSNSKEVTCTPKRKLKFDSEVSPLNMGGNVSSVTSPESLSLKRSRSGRLLMPILDFWRNQKAVYDKTGQVTAIHDGPSVLEVSPQGNKSKTHSKSKADH